MDEHPVRDILDNIQENSQFIMQRIENNQLLSGDILQDHNSLDINLGGGGFITVNYPTEDLLSQDLTEEDRNLAAALVAVQLSQQQKQQQLQQENALLNGGPLPPIVKTINANYLQIVEQNDTLNKLIDERNFAYDQSPLIKSPGVLDEDSFFQKDDDIHLKIHSIVPNKQKLPHKKRISRKLKKSSSLASSTSKRLVNTNGSRVNAGVNASSNSFLASDDDFCPPNLCDTEMSSINVSSPFFTCQLCLRSFTDQLRFFHHLKQHYEPAHVRIRNNEGLSERTMAKSLAARADSQYKEEASLVCLKCNKCFRRQENLEAHIKHSHKSRPVTPVKAEYDEFSEPEDLMDGINVGHMKIEDEAKTWYREDELHATEEDLRELEAQEYLCQICNKELPSRSLLNEHIAICSKQNNSNQIIALDDDDDTEEDPLPVSPPSPISPPPKSNKKATMFSCTLCDKVFTYKNSLVYHMRSHTGTRPHHCDQCGKNFFSSSALKIHIRMHTGDKPYKCEFCGKDFRQWGDLKYHCISIHSDSRQYQCEYCGKDFARKYSLVLHRRIHTGEKNYSCEYCAKSFRASTYLKNHIRIHTGEKPYSCDICKKKFRVSSDMKRHMKTHTRKRPTSGNIGIFPQDPEKANEQDPLVNNHNDDGSNEESKEEDGESGNIEYDQERDTVYVMPILIT